MVQASGRPGLSINCCHGFPIDAVLRAAYLGRKPSNTYQQFSLPNLNRIKTRMLAIRYRTKMRMMPY